MDLLLKDKVALVTGAGSQIGFGKAIAITLAKEGCNIIASDIDLEGAEKTAAEVKSLGRNAVAIRANVTNSVEVDEMVKIALNEFRYIDILINNAGATNKPKPFAAMPEGWIDADININLKGALVCTKAIINHMIERKYGKIVNISSASGKRGFPGATAYAAAKSGVIGFTRALASEVSALGININCVAPGIARTSFTRQISNNLQNIVATIPIGRLTEPQDIANMVAYLASDVASDIVGQTFSVDGGLTLC